MTGKSAEMSVSASIMYFGLKPLSPERSACRPYRKRSVYSGPLFAVQDTAGVLQQVDGEVKPKIFWISVVSTKTPVISRAFADKLVTPLVLFLSHHFFLTLVQRLLFFAHDIYSNGYIS